MNPDMSVWTGRDDTPTEGPNALRWWQCVKPYRPDAEPGIVLIGFACDEGVRRNGGRVGAKDGPRALRKALANMAFRYKECNAYDAGDIECTSGDLEAAQDRLAELVASALRDGQRPIVIGGGHETSWGSFQGLTRVAQERTVGIVNFDAHFDLREDKRATSGTPFSQVAQWCKEHLRPFKYVCYGISETGNTQALFDRAQALGVDFRFDYQLESARLGHACDSLLKFAQSVTLLHLSIDLDVLANWVMPAVSAPSVRGLSLETLEQLLGALEFGAFANVIDLVEFNPTFDPDGNAARIAAGLLAKMAMVSPDH